VKEYRLSQDILDRFFPDQWQDQQGQVNQAAAVAGLTYEPILDTLFSIYWFKHNQTDRLFLSYQFQHGWDKGEVQPHIHVLPSAGTGGDLVISGRYMWSAPNSGIAFSTWSNWTTYSATRTITSGENNTEVAFNLFTTTPPALAQKPSATLFMTVERVSGSGTYTGSKVGGGTASANVGLLFLDVHQLITKTGTLTPYGAT
jgi:hypothetical protein